MNEPSESSPAVALPIDPIDFARTRARVLATLCGRADAPTTIDRYVVLGTAGQGGMGRVYRARDPSLGRIVALKCLDVDARGTEGRAFAEVLAEARAMAALSHP